jgi:Gram-negative bacterial TonB protein C-terminal
MALLTLLQEAFPRHSNKPSRLRIPAALHALTLKAAITTLYAVVFCATCMFGGNPAKPVVYNNVDGDGSAELDRGIKGAYSERFTIVDTGRSRGFAEPDATQGTLPTSATGEAGQPLAGYVLVAYIVSAGGFVTDPVVLKTTDARLSEVAIAAMSHWRFTPGRLNGDAVATTAAQEFNFGAADPVNGFRTDRIAVYQEQQVLLKRLPGPEVFGAYAKELGRVAHNFFVGDTVPEKLDIVVALQPGGSPRVWLVSSIREGDAKELEPLRKLLRAVPPIEVRDGPVAFAVQASIAGGGAPPADNDSPPPVPKEWRKAGGSQKEGVAYSSDEFLNAICKEAQ